MKNKLFIFGIVLAVVMLTGCPALTDDTQQPLDITESENVYVADGNLSVWQQLESVAVAKGYGAYCNRYDIYALTVYTKAKRAGVGLHAVEFNLEGDTSTIYILQVTVNEDRTATFGAWVKVQLD